MNKLKTKGIVEMSEMFNRRGFEEAVEVEAKNQKARENRGKQLWRFFLKKDGDEATIRFLTETPINFYEHTLKGFKNGKETYDSVPCLSQDCPHCAKGDKPSYKGAFLIYDKRPSTYTDKMGTTHELDGQLRLYVQGAKVVSQLKRLSERYSLTGRDYTITRSGSGTSTSYMFDRSDATSKLSEKEIRDMLPEALRTKYNGTADSLLDIVENQIAMSVGLDTDDEEEEVSEKANNVISVDDIGKKAPATTTLKPKPTAGKLPFKKSAENSAKKLFTKK